MTLLAPTMEYDSILHVSPVNDLLEHDEDTPNCWCDPILDEQDGGLIVVHNSFDGRERRRVVW